MGWQKIMGELIYIPNIKECDCPVCGKHFVPASHNIYKIRAKNKKGKWYNEQDVCSYTCWRKWEKDREIAKEKKRAEAERKRKERVRLRAEERRKAAGEYEKGADIDAADSERVFATN